MVCLALLLTSPGRAAGLHAVTGGGLRAARPTAHGRKTSVRAYRRRHGVCRPTARGRKNLDRIQKTPTPSLRGERLPTVPPCLQNAKVLPLGACNAGEAAQLTCPLYGAVRRRGSGTGRDCQSVAADALSRVVRSLAAPMEKDNPIFRQSLWVSKLYDYFILCAPVCQPVFAGSRSAFECGVGDVLRNTLVERPLLVH